MSIRWRYYDPVENKYVGSVFNSYMSALEFRDEYETKQGRRLVLEPLTPIEERLGHSHDKMSRIPTSY